MNGKQKLTLFFTILDAVGYKNSSRLVFFFLYLQIKLSFLKKR